eukprot:3353676-Amphidinium_carterae.1
MCVHSSTPCALSCYAHWSSYHAVGCIVTYVDETAGVPLLTSCYGRVLRKRSQGLLKLGLATFPVCASLPRVSHLFLVML